MEQVRKAKGAALPRSTRSAGVEVVETNPPGRSGVPGTCTRTLPGVKITGGRRGHRGRPGNSAIMSLCYPGVQVRSTYAVRQAADVPLGAVEARG